MPIRVPFPEFKKYYSDYFSTKTTSSSLDNNHQFQCRNANELEDTMKELICESIKRTNINIIDDFNATGNFSMVGVDIMIDDEGNTFIHIAGISKNYGFLKFLERFKVRQISKFSILKQTHRCGKCGSVNSS